MDHIFELCELCGAALDADNCDGEEDFPLCRYHHEVFGVVREGCAGINQTVDKQLRMVV